MSAIPNINDKPRLTTSYCFSKVPAVASWNTPAITPAPHSNISASVRSVSATACRPRQIDREEPCFITKSVSYTHEPIHWVTAVTNNPTVKEQVEKLLIGRGIVHQGFDLEMASNLTNMDRSLHAALDSYAFFAVTGTLDSLNSLITLLENDNQRRQKYFDDYANELGRAISLYDPPVSNFSYELVVLRPEHLLPDRSILTAYERSSGQVSIKTYMVGADRTLRESPADDVNTCKRFPSFKFDSTRAPIASLNPFLVLLNADIKFRRYLREDPQPTGLPADVMTLIHKTIELVELIYWDPVVRPGTRAADIFALVSAVKVPQQADVEMEELSMKDGEEDVPTVQQSDDIPNVGGIQPPGPSATLQERREFGQYLMSGRDLPLSDDDDDSFNEEYDSDEINAG